MIKGITIILSLLLLIVVIELSRRDKLTFKYAAGWLVLAVLGLLASVFERILFWVADFFGFILTSNFIFFVLFCFLIFLSLFLTVFLCQQNNRTDLLAQEFARLELKVKQMIKEKNGTG